MLWLGILQIGVMKFEVFSEVQGMGIGGYCDPIWGIGFGFRWRSLIVCRRLAWCWDGVSERIFVNHMNRISSHWTLHSKLSASNSRAVLPPARLTPRTPATMKDRDLPSSI